MNIGTDFEHKWKDENGKTWAQDKNGDVYDYDRYLDLMESGEAAFQALAGSRTAKKVLTEG